MKKTTMEPREVAHQVQVGLADARVALTHADRRTRQFVRQRPLAALVAAVGIGYVLARISSRI